MSDHISNLSHDSEADPPGSAVIDLVPFYPAALVPPISHTLRKFYVSSYRDRFFIVPTNWFRVYAALEGLYHLPATLWMLQALPKADPMVPLHLLVFAMETGVTTLTCLAEMLSWEGYTTQELLSLSTLYGPYLAFGEFIEHWLKDVLMCS